jgi:hypothetical protein
MDVSLPEMGGWDAVFEVESFSDWEGRAPASPRQRLILRARRDP